MELTLIHRPPEAFVHRDVVWLEALLSDLEQILRCYLCLIEFPICVHADVSLRHLYIHSHHVVFAGYSAAGTVQRVNQAFAANIWKISLWADVQNTP